MADVIVIILCGRWYTTRLQATAFEDGRCYCQVADGIATFFTVIGDGRSINNTINMFKIQVDTCKNHLENTLDKESMEECIGFIKKKKESRHWKTLDHQKFKFQRLCHKSRTIKGGYSNTQYDDHDEIETNNTSDSRITTYITRKNEEEENNNNVWIRNISSTPLTETQLKVLSHGPNFAMAPRCPLVGKYIASIKQECSQLNKGRQKTSEGRSSPS